MIKKNLLPILSYILVALSLIVFQSSRRFSLWDFANYTDLGIRIANGQIPYIDFPLYTQPGSFLEIAFFTKFLGQNIYAIYFPIVLKIILLGIMINFILKNVFKSYIEFSILKRILVLFFNTTQLPNFYFHIQILYFEKLLLQYHMNLLKYLLCFLIL